MYHENIYPVIDHIFATAERYQRLTPGNARLLTDLPGEVVQQHKSIWKKYYRGNLPTCILIRLFEDENLFYPLDDSLCAQYDLCIDYRYEYCTRPPNNVQLEMLFRASSKEFIALYPPKIIRYVN
jgi:hypothetical protein